MCVPWCGQCSVASLTLRTVTVQWEPAPCAWAARASDGIGAQNGPRGAACRAGRVAASCCRSDLVRSLGERRIHPATPTLPGEWFSDLLF